jgi:hypothetical protein
MGMNIARWYPAFQVTGVMTNSKGFDLSALRNFQKGYELSSGKQMTLCDLNSQTVFSTWNGRDSMLCFVADPTGTGASAAIRIAEKPNFIAMGYADWMDGDRSNYNVFNNVHFYDPFFVNTTDSFYVSFRKMYRENYGGDPGRYTIIGYDHMLFFGQALMAFGKKFPASVLNREFPLHYNSYNIVARGNLIENTGAAINYYYNYQYHNVCNRPRKR